jgi:hypothetical protein
LAYYEAMDKQARLDAMADAEALWCVFGNGARRKKAIRELTFSLQSAYCALSAIRRNDPSIAYSGARLAARYAIRAVPGLRG